MLNAIVATLAGSQTKMMGVIGGISVLINQFRHQLSIGVSNLLGHAVRPEIVDVILSLGTIAVAITLLVAFALYILKGLARSSRSNKLAHRFASAHMGAVASLSKAAGSGDLGASLRPTLSDLVHEVEAVQKKSKKLRARNPELSAAYSEYVHQLTVFSAATGGARISDDQPLEANLAGLTEAAFALMDAFGASKKSRKFRKQKNVVRANAAEVDHALRGQLGAAPTQMPTEAAGRSKSKKEKHDATPDVIVRTQKARAGKRMSRRERRKLSPWDQPERVRTQQHTGEN